MATITCDLLKFIILGVKGGSEMKGAAKNVREIISIQVVLC